MFFITTFSHWSERMSYFSLHHIATNVACVGHPVSTAKLAEPMEMLFGGQTHVGPNNHVLDWGILCMGVKLICVLVSCKTK